MTPFGPSPGRQTWVRLNKKRYRDGHAWAKSVHRCGSYLGLEGHCEWAAPGEGQTHKRVYACLISYLSLGWGGGKSGKWVGLTEKDGKCGSCWTLRQWAPRMLRVLGLSGKECVQMWVPAGPGWGVRVDEARETRDAALPESCPKLLSRRAACNEGSGLNSPRCSSAAPSYTQA